MLKSKEYAAAQDFSMSFDNGKTPIYVKKGDTMLFDGLNVVFKGEQGTARSLAKVIGEWIVPIGASTKTGDKVLSTSSRNATAGRILEHSDYPSDPLVGVKNPPSDSVEALLKTYERVPETKLVNGKREVTSDIDDIKKEVTIIHEDASVVRKVTANDGAPITNKNSVEIEDGTHKKAVLSTDGDIAKKTNYSGKEDEVSGKRKKLTIDYESSGVEVRKTSSTKPKVIKAASKKEVVVMDAEMGETSYPSIQTTEVGSSTQAQVEQSKTTKKTTTKKTTAKKKVAKKKTAKKKAVKKKVVSTTETDVLESIIDSTPIADELIDNVVISDEVLDAPKGRMPIIELDGQEAVVVSKVTRDIDSGVQTQDGITSRVTVGASEGMDVGEVEFSSNNTFEEPTATFHAGEGTPFDASEVDINDRAESNTEISSGDIDINDILSEV